MFSLLIRTTIKRLDDNDVCYLTKRDKHGATWISRLHLNAAAAAAVLLMIIALDTDEQPGLLSQPVLLLLLHNWLRSCSTTDRFVFDSSFPLFLLQMLREAAAEKGGEIKAGAFSTV